MLSAVKVLILDCKQQVAQEYLNLGNIKLFHWYIQGLFAGPGRLIK